MTDRFWEIKQLEEMTPEEWESLCDGCAKCCLIQLQDEETEQLVYTNVACDLLDTQTCRCTDYKCRSVRVPTCMTLTPKNLETALEFAPDTCAYRLVFEGKPLPSWHYLISGEATSIHKADQSVFGKIILEHEVDADDIEDHVVDWP